MLLVRLKMVLKQTVYIAVRLQKESLGDRNYNLNLRTSSNSGLMESRCNSSAIACMLNRFFVLEAQFYDLSEKIFRYEVIHEY